MNFFVAKKQYITGCAVVPPRLIAVHPDMLKNL